MSSETSGAYEEKSKNNENREDKFTPLIRQDASAEPSRPAEMMTSEDMNERSRDLFDDKVTFESLNLIHVSRLANTLTIVHLSCKTNRRH